MIDGTSGPEGADGGRRERPGIHVQQGLLVGLILLLAAGLGFQVVASAAEETKTAGAPASMSGTGTPAGTGSGTGRSTLGDAQAEMQAQHEALSDSQAFQAPVPQPKGIATRPLAQYWNGDLAGLRSDLDAVKAAKAGWLRAPLRYTSKPDPGFDALVRMAEHRNIKLLLTVNKPSPQRDLGTSADQARYRAWLARMVKRYGHYVKHWMIINEPNLRYDWTIDYAVNSDQGRYQASVDRYVRHLRNSYRVIKEIDPDATVIFGGLSEWRVERYIDALATTNAYRYFDVMGFHPYARTPVSVLSRYRSFTAKMKSYPAYASKPVWVTEFGFNSTWSHKPGYVGTEKRKAAYLVDAMRLLNAAGAEGPIFWYDLHQDRSVEGFGLIRRETGQHRYARLPSFAAFRDLTLLQRSG